MTNHAWHMVTCSGSCGQGFRYREMPKQKVFVCAKVAVMLGQVSGESPIFQRVGFESTTIEVSAKC